MVSSAMELQLGVFGFLPTTHMETNANTTSPWSLCFMCAYLQLLDCSSYVPYESRLFWWCEKPKYPPIGAPNQEKDGEGFGISGLISVGTFFVK